MVRVTAMVPTWNGEAFVADTLASLVAQDHAELEILVSDDASDDGTLAICRRFAADDDRVRVVAQPRRLGWIGNSRALLDAVDSPLAFYAPHDDLFAPTYVSACVAALAAAPDAVLAYAKTLRRDAAGVVRPWRTDVGLERDRVARAAAYLCGRDDARWVPIRGVARTDVMRHVGGLRRGLAPAADGRLLFRLALEGRFVRVEEPLVEKRWQPTSAATGIRNRPLLWELAYLPEILAADVRGPERRALVRILASELRRRGRQVVRDRRAGTGCSPPDA